jgi:tRNA A37 threonylcarbamoyladenosine dehydratase
MTPQWLERTELLLGEEKLALLRRAHVLVVGLGGVGAYAAEMIARAGVGRLTIADADVVSPTNINRQLVALHSTIGRPKAEILAARLRDINPEIELTTVNKYIRDDLTWELLDAAGYDFVVDAIDTLSPKAALIKGALDRGLPLVSSMGAGAKTDPTKVEIRDIAASHHCPLAHMLRKRLHKWGIHTGFWAVFSPEPIREGAMILAEETNKKSNVGTISYMPAVFGCACASVVIRGICGELSTEGATSPTGIGKSAAGWCR